MKIALIFGLSVIPSSLTYAKDEGTSDLFVNTKTPAASVLTKLWRDQVFLAQEASFLNMGRMHAEDFSAIGTAVGKMIAPYYSLSSWYDQEALRLSQLAAKYKAHDEEIVQEKFAVALNAYKDAMSELESISLDVAGSFREQMQSDPNFMTKFLDWSFSKEQTVEGLIALSSENFLGEFAKLSKFDSLLKKMVDSFESLVLVSETEADVRSFPVRLARLRCSLPAAEETKDVRWMGSGKPYSPDEPILWNDHQLTSLATNAAFFTIIGSALWAYFKFHENHPAAISATLLTAIPTAFVAALILTGKTKLNFPNILNRFAYWRWKNSKLKNIFTTTDDAIEAFQTYVIVKKYLLQKDEKHSFAGFSINCSQLLSRLPFLFR